MQYGRSSTMQAKVLTEQELAEIRELLKGTQPDHDGDWRIVRFNGGFPYIESTMPICRFVCRLPFDDGIGLHYGDFFIKSRENISNLLATVEHQNRVIGVLLQECGCPYRGDGILPCNGTTPDCDKCRLKWADEESRKEG
jgi:hypothetical protein